VSEKTNGGLSNGSTPAAGDGPAAGGGSDFTLVPLSTVPQQAISWCWHRRIPRGMVTVLAGYQKSGKTFVACKIAATITRGRKFPGCKRKTKSAVVIDDRQIPVFHRRSPIRKMKKGRAGEAHREMRIQTETTICCAIDPDHKS
jgi:hypothetical protein